MKKCERMKRRFRLCCSILLLGALIALPLSVQAADNRLTYPLYHKHIGGCEETVYKTISANGSCRVETIKTDTCSSCGGHHDYYSFRAYCSCGKNWSSSGHACINSPYGTNHGSCSNYSAVNSNTSHSHPVKEYVCGLGEDSVIGTVYIDKSTVLPCQEMKLCASSEGDLEHIQLSWKDGLDGSEITVCDNGTYYLHVTYSENAVEYITEIAVEVNNIDKTPPIVGEITAGETAFTADNVILSLTAEDEYGLPEAFVSWNGGEYTAETAFEVSANGVYEAVVRDLAGNTVSRSITISNIDKTAPEMISYKTNPSPWYSGSCDVTVVAQDGEKESGLAEQPYSWDGGVTWTESASYTLTEPGTLSVWIKDAVGNIAQEEINLQRSSKPKPPETGDNQAPEEIPEKESEPEESAPQPEESEEETAKEELPSEPDSMNFDDEKVVSEEEMVEVEVVTVEEESFYSEGEKIKIESIENKNTGPDGKILITIGLLGAIIGSGVIIFLLYVLFGICRIYEVDKHNAIKYLGRSGIRYGQRRYEIRIRDGIIHKASTRNMQIKMPDWFVKTTGYKPLRIVIGKQVIEKYVEKEINFHVNI